MIYFGGLGGGVEEELFLLGVELFALLGFLLGFGDAAGFAVE